MTKLIICFTVRKGKCIYLLGFFTISHICLSSFVFLGSSKGGRLPATAEREPDTALYYDSLGFFTYDNFFYVLS